jgi:small GTP-binding protein
MAEFKYDVFISHSSKDEDAVTQLAEQLNADGLRVWFDKWEIRPGDRIPSKIEEGLENSRVLLSVMSRAAGSDWQTLESHTFLFRDPHNHDRRFIPLLLEDTKVPDMLRQFRHIDWRERKVSEYKALLASCRAPERSTAEIHRGPDAWGRILNLAVSAMWVDNGASKALAILEDNNFVAVDVESKHITANLSRHAGSACSMAVTRDGRVAVTGGADGVVRFWDISIRWMREHARRHSARINSVAVNVDGSFAASGSSDGQVCVWDVAGAKLVASYQFDGRVNSVCFLPDGDVLVGGTDPRNRLVIWRPNDKKDLVKLPGHSSSVSSVAISADGVRAVSGSWDRTVRVWDLKTCNQMATLEGHKQEILAVDIGDTGMIAVSGGGDSEVRLWNLSSGQCIETLVAPSAVSVLKLITGSQRLFSGTGRGLFLCDISRDRFPEKRQQAEDQYTNAKVILSGPSSAGKTGLATRLTTGLWTPTDSTAGARAKELKVVKRGGGQREIWLWDFGGQLDFMLIHQLFMDEASMAILVFDPQREDQFRELRVWDRALTRAARKSFSKLLVAGRCDVAGLRDSREGIDDFVRERGFSEYIETSAKTGMGCDQLLEAIESKIAWDEIPYTSSPRLFSVLKKRIFELRNEGRTLLRIEELKQQIEMMMPGVDFRYPDLRAVCSLLAGPGVIWELEFGDFVLLNPEWVEAYAGALFRSVRAQEHDWGLIQEEVFVKGELQYEGMQRLSSSEEQIVLQALYQMLLRRGFCLREVTDKGVFLIFPSYFRATRPERRSDDLQSFVTYKISGTLQELYATLVVRLRHTTAFEKADLWKFAADFRTQDGKRLGLSLKMEEFGSEGDLTVYFDPSISEDTRLTFARYVHDHVTRNADSFERKRHYACPACHTPVDLRSSEKALRLGLNEVNCAICPKRILLHDLMEQRFASADIAKRTLRLVWESKAKIEGQESTQLLVGELLAIATKAGHVYRQRCGAAHGIDDEIEFRDYSGELSGRKLYLQTDLNACYEVVPVPSLSHDENPAEQIRSAAVVNEIALDTGDPNFSSKPDLVVLRLRSSAPSAEWARLRHPLMLVLRDSSGMARWMDIRQSLMAPGERIRKYILFQGEPVTLSSLQQYRNVLVESNAA